MRRDHLISILERNDMFPNSEKEIPFYYDQDPYSLRKKGLTEKLTLHEFGRAMLHINARRGFRSNRKTGGNDEGKIFDGTEGNAGIIEAQNAIKDGGYKTIGEYLNSLDPHENPRRKRFTLRKRR